MMRRKKAKSGSSKLVWSPEYGWVQTLQALEAKRPREGDDETPQDSKVPRTNKGKGKSKGKGLKK